MASSGKCGSGRGGGGGHGGGAAPAHAELTASMWQAELAYTSFNANTSRGRATTDSALSFADASVCAIAVLKCLQEANSHVVLCSVSHCSPQSPNGPDQPYHVLKQLSYKHHIESPRTQLVGVRQKLQEQLLHKHLHEMDQTQRQLFTELSRMAASLQLAVDEKPKLWCSGRFGDSAEHVCGHELDYSNCEIVTRDAQNYYRWTIFAYGFAYRHVADLENEPHHSHCSTTKEAIVLDETFSEIAPDVIAPDVTSHGM